MSSTDTPAFQQMIERACDGSHSFDRIIVHSYSRFFREAFEQEFYLRKLAKHGVRSSRSPSRSAMRTNLSTP